MRIKLFIASFFICLFAISQAQIVLTQEETNKRVDAKEALYFSSSQNILFEDVLLDEYQRQFIVGSGKSLVAQDPKLEYWVKIPFKIESNAHWLFQTFTVHADSMDIYIPTSQGYNKRSLGTVGSHIERQVQIPELIFELENLRGNQAIYLRVKSKVPVTVESLFRTEGYFIHYSSRENIFRGLFYGLISAIGLLALFLYLFSREKLYLFYSLYIFSTVLYNLVQSSVGHFFFWPEAYQFNYVLLRYTALPFLILCSIYYTGKYIELNAVLQKYQNRTLAFLFAMVGVEFTNTLPAYLPLAVGAITCYGMLFYFIKKTKRYQQGFDRYFVVGFVLMVVAVALVFLRLFRIIESNIYSYYAFHAGLMLEATLFTISLAGRYNKINKERSLALQEELVLSQKNESLQADLITQLEENKQLQTKVQRELEGEVKKRTLELKEKNVRLEEFNQNLETLVGDLQKMNIHLDKSNWQLKRASKSTTKERFLNKQLNWEEFQEAFPDDISCKHYLSNIKWENEFVCVKCGGTKYYDGKQKLSRKCSSCAYEESTTANTIFKGIKCDLNKAFYIAHCSFNQSKITSKDLASLLDLKEETCRRFHKKVKVLLDENPDKKGESIFLV